MGQDLMHVYAAEEISHFLEHGGCLVPMFLEGQVIISSIQKSQVQICHQQSLVIGSLAPWESVFHQMDVTLYLLVTAMLLHSFITQLYL